MVAVLMLLLTGACGEVMPRNMNDLRFESVEAAYVPPYRGTYPRSLVRMTVSMSQNFLTYAEGDPSYAIYADVGVCGRLGESPSTQLGGVPVCQQCNGSPARYVYSFTMLPALNVEKGVHYCTRLVGVSFLDRGVRTNEVEVPADVLAAAVTNAKAMEH